MGNTLRVPASITGLVFGIALIAYSPAWNFGQTWVLIGLAGIAATIITGAAWCSSPASSVGARRTSAGGTDDPPSGRTTTARTARS
jgi:hypothetical protein